MTAHVEGLAGANGHKPPGLLLSVLRGLRGVAVTEGPRPLLGRGERILATESDEAGARLVATTLALYQGAAEEAWRRLAWEEVIRLSWDPDRGRLDVTGVDGHHVVANLPLQSRLGTLARERVAATLLVSRRVGVGAGAPATVVARRRPPPAEVVWLVRVDGGANPERPDVVEAIEAVIRSLRVEIAVPPVL